jgi:predicted negative regulator of RcsB-dependent stress response
MERHKTMRRVIKAVFVLAILGFVGLVGYAYLADLAPEVSDVKVPVILNVD